MSEEKLKEKLVSGRIDNYDSRCPNCREKGTTPVLPFGDDMFFCENANCPVTRHSNVGHYEFTEDSIYAPNVNYVHPDSYKKRKVIKKSI